MQFNRSPVKKIAIVGSYVPRQCGIATFTCDLANSLKSTGLEVGVIVVSDKAGYAYGDDVHFEIAEQDEQAYIEAAKHLNNGGYDVVSVQHEYGIFGGEYGKHLLTMLRRVNIPIVTTLHTVLREPEPRQKAVMDELLQLSERVVVMSELAIAFLVDVHKVCRSKIDLIHHGIPDIAPDQGIAFREELNIAGPMILTFGLLSPDKGIEFVINAMPKITAEHPEAVYVVLGATHPNVRASCGEAYRDQLTALTRELNVEHNVRFVDRFATIEELTGYLGATDIYVTPYLNPRQITSGTLAYAVGAGKAVVSTPYWYAQELLGKGRGSLVPFRDSAAVSKSIVEILGNRSLKDSMQSKAKEFGEQMRWPAVGRRYQECFDRGKSDTVNRLKELNGTSHKNGKSSVEDPTQVRLDHLLAMTDDTGLLQHSTYSVPNRSHGYCVDDNARALFLTTLLDFEQPSIHKARLQSRYLSFVMHAFNEENGRFRNFMGYDRQWLEDLGSEDSHGRTCWSIAALVARSPSLGLREAARTLLASAMPALYDTTSPRTWAYAVLACDERLRSEPEHPQTRALLHEMSRRLLAIYNATRSEDWLWFEDSLSYCNARLSQALMLAGKSSGDRMTFEAGIESLEWLNKVQTGPGGVFAPVSTQGYHREDRTRTYFDQQPVEAWATVSACLTAHSLTQNDSWLHEAQRAFRWFRGANMIQADLVDHETQGCCDGLHPERVNLNQGAESTLSYLCAKLELRQAAILKVPVLSQVSYK